MHRNSFLIFAAFALGACTMDLGFPLADIGDTPRKPLEYTAPVNLPPQNYTGDIWVDNDGCIFLLANDGEWVPQVNQKRIQMCDKAAMLAYAKQQKRGIQSQKRPEQVISENALNVQQALATVSVENPQAAPASFADLPIDASRAIAGQTFVHVSVDDPENGFQQIIEKFESRDFSVLGTNEEEGALVLGPFAKGSDIQDALVTAWSFGFLNAFPFKK